MRRKKRAAKRAFILVAGFAALLAAASFVVQDNEAPVVEQKQEATVIQESREETVARPVLRLSQVSLEQSDTLVVVAENVPAGVVPQGTFLTREVSFFPLKDVWMAIVGVDAKRSPGSYGIAVVLGDDVLRDTVTLAKRAFPVTKLVVTEDLEERGYTPDTIAENIAVVENRKLQEVMMGYSTPFAADQPFFYPLNRIVNVGAYGNIRQSGDIVLQHLGVDLAAAVGDSVYSINNGRVVLSDNFTNYGKIIVIDHGFGIYSLYLHLDKRFVAVGDEVKRGEMIAQAGNTGYSIAPHLHFSVKVAGESVDPLRFLETVNKEF